MDEINISIKTAKKWFEKNNFERTIQILQEVIQKNRKLLEKEELKTELGEINLLLAKSLLAHKKLDESLNKANECLQLALKSKNYSLQAKILRVLGSVYSQKGNHIKSLDLLRKSLKLEQKIGDKIGESYALFELGLQEADGEEFAESVDHLNRALKIFKTLNLEKEAKKVERELNIIMEEMNESKWLESKIPKKLQLRVKKKYQL
ncbi:MAG: tetratricopeptide repeat protein [Candidatus Helarchaeota archaeon]